MSYMHVYAYILTKYTIMYKYACTYTNVHAHILPYRYVHTNNTHAYSADITFTQTHIRIRDTAVKIYFHQKEPFHRSSTADTYAGTLTLVSTSYHFSPLQYRMTPLLTAVYGGQKDTVALLLERGADIDAYDSVHPSIA